jgi:hypothetical protein
MFLISFVPKDSSAPNIGPKRTVILWAETKHHALRDFEKIRPNYDLVTIVRVGR